MPRPNLVPSIAEYRARVAAAGFVSVDVTDAKTSFSGGVPTVKDGSAHTGQLHFSGTYTIPVSIVGRLLRPPWSGHWQSGSRLGHEVSIPIAIIGGSRPMRGHRATFEGLNDASGLRSVGRDADRCHRWHRQARLGA